MPRRSVFDARDDRIQQANIAIEEDEKIREAASAFNLRKTMFHKFVSRNIIVRLLQERSRVLTGAQKEEVVGALTQFTENGIKFSELHLKEEIVIMIQ